MKRFFVLFALGALGLVAVQAGEIYRWVDDKGRVQLSDRVPEAYKNSATRVDTSASQLTPAQRQEAANRAAQEKVRAAEAEAREARIRVAPPPQPAASTAADKPVESSCAAQRRRFQENATCLGAYKIANGGFKPGAFESCGPSLPPPPEECTR